MLEQQQIRREYCNVLKKPVPGPHAMHWYRLLETLVQKGLVGQCHRRLSKVAFKRIDSAKLTSWVSLNHASIVPVQDQVRLEIETYKSSCHRLLFHASEAHA